MERIGSTYRDFGLERFFKEKLGVKTASASMLITELTKLAEGQSPPVQTIREMLIDIGGMLARNKVDDDLPQALDLLKRSKFLPIKSRDNTLALKSIDDDFAILDHARFGNAFQAHSIILDFSLEESQILDSLFQKLGLVDRYLSRAVKEISVVDGEPLEDQVLSQELRTKAYALFW